jgi:hypothetical protein
MNENLLDGANKGLLKTPFCIENDSRPYSVDFSASRPQRSVGLVSKGLNVTAII